MLVVSGADLPQPAGGGRDAERCWQVRSGTAVSSLRQRFTSMPIKVKQGSRRLANQKQPQQPPPEPAPDAAPTIAELEAKRATLRATLLKVEKQASVHSLPAFVASLTAELPV